MRGYAETADEVRDLLEVSTERRGTEMLAERHFIARKDGEEGWPDRLVLVNQSRHFWWEAKKPRGGRLTPAQRRVIPMLRARGDIVLIRPSLGELLTVAMLLAAGNEAGARAAPSANTEV